MKEGAEVKWRTEEEERNVRHKYQEKVQTDFPEHNTKSAAEKDPLKRR